MSSTTELASKLREAVALGKEKGLDTTPWEIELANLEQKLNEAEHTVNRTCQLLDTRGWCKWQCEALGDDVVVIARDDKVIGLPHGLAVYTMQEFQHLFGGSKPISRSTLRLSHEAKKLFGARVTSCTPNHPGATTPSIPPVPSPSACRSHPPTGAPELDKACRSHAPTGDLP